MNQNLVIVYDLTPKLVAWDYDDPFSNEVVNYIM